MKEGRSAFKILTDKPKGKRTLERPRRRCEDDINRRMDIKEIVVNTKNSVDSPQGRDYWRPLVNAALNFWIL